jgi:hypothetical protein
MSDFDKLIIWDELKKVNWTGPQWEMVKMVLEDLLDKMSDSFFMEDNPDFLTSYDVQMFYFLDQLNLYLDLAYDESEVEYRRVARIVNAIIDKLLKRGLITSKLLRDVERGYVEE